MKQSIDDEHRVLMSEELNGVLFQPDQQTDNKFIVVIITTPDMLLVGSLVGIELSDTPKIDFKVSLNEAMLALSLFNEDKKLQLSSISLKHKTTGAVEINDKFEVTAIKILDINHEIEIVTLALDLMKVMNT